MPVEERDIKVLETAQANLFFVVSHAFSSPLEMDDEYASLLRKLAPDLSPVLRDPVLFFADAWASALSDREKLSLAYARLFLGPFEILASPYESFYLEPDQRLMGEVSTGVARAYADAGLGPGSAPREAPDHVALELEFLYFLTHQFITTGDEKWRETRQRFLSVHFNRWLPALGAAIVKADEHPFYNALAAVLAALQGSLEGHTRTNPEV